ncbi:MAG TPA: hypothetical protein VL485_27845 [Ktedonobacteraceae bacterium]|nr:hypothetical protein [Ktedonobacteraceae bacterium]
MMEEAAEKKAVACPYCASTETERISLFGQQLLTMHYYCHTCHTPFACIKDDDLFCAEEAAPGDPLAHSGFATEICSNERIPVHDNDDRAYPGALYDR